MKKQIDEYSGAVKASKCEKCGLISNFDMDECPECNSECNSLEKMKLGDLRRLKAMAIGEWDEWCDFVEKICDELKRRGKI